MNILIPDAWLREFLKTKATPSQLKEYLSLCGPSIERINTENGEIVYDIEITTNRPDSMSVSGVAREAAAILPRFGIKATLAEDPYRADTAAFLKTHRKEGTKQLAIHTDPRLNPRWSSIVLTDVKVGPSPDWLRRKLERTGIRPVNSIVDITNYLMRAYGQPAHAFDYDEIKPRNGVPTMILRAARKGEKLVTLDGKEHTLPGGDIVIEDGSGRLIDLCGIMGGGNSAIKESTTTVVLFLQTYDPVRIRRTSMALSHRTEAAALFEKGIDSELVIPALMRGIDLAAELAGAKPASRVYDLYPAPYKPTTVTVPRKKLDAYLGISLKTAEIAGILKDLGFTPAISAAAVSVRVPSFRRDVTLDVDVIEEVARLYGYHRIRTRLPENEPPVVLPDPTLVWEEELKIRLRDWGYTETYTYSMISAELMKTFALDPRTAYTISNPLSSEWVYMRPSLIPSLVKTMGDNLRLRDEIRLFELSMEYHARTQDLPWERPTLAVAWSGSRFAELKGLAQAIFSLFGIPFPTESEPSDSPYVLAQRSFRLGKYGWLGELAPTLGTAVGIGKPVTILKLEIDTLIKDAAPQKRYTPIPKYPPVREDYSFTVPAGFRIGALLEAIRTAHPLVREITIIDSFKDSRTIRVAFQDPERTLTNEDIKPVREIVHAVITGSGARLKTI